MTLRYAMASLWLLFTLIPLLWWLRTRRHIDLWEVMPVPLALLDRAGQPARQTGPATDSALTPSSGLPAPGTVVRTRSTDGTPLALSGLRRGGAVAVALPADPVGERRDRVLAELGARLAHDINTPLSALLGHLDLLTHQPLDHVSLQSVRTCQRELARLQTTAQDLLTYTRLRAGGSPRMPHHAGALAEEAAAALLDRADNLEATLTVHVPVEPVLVHVAEAEIIRALRNLLSNALCYGLGERREVTILVEASAKSVTFAVTDSGPGLSPDRLRELSQPLVRGREARGSGSGLGLAIVAEILSGHGTGLQTDHWQGRQPRLFFVLPRYQ